MFHRSESTIAHVDPEIWASIQAENRRQEEHIELIASENFTYPAVLQAQARHVQQHQGRAAVDRVLDRLDAGLDPVQGVRAPKAPKPLPKALGVDEAVQLAEHSHADEDPWLQARDAAMVELLYGCGLRVGELEGLDIAASSTAALPQTQVVDGKLARVLSWYDNEWGYSNRLVEAVADLGKTIHR